jgi:hypothetical protein
VTSYALGKALNTKILQSTESRSIPFSSKDPEVQLHRHVTKKVARITDILSPSSAPLPGRTAFLHLPVWQLAEFPYVWPGYRKRPRSFTSPGSDASRDKYKCTGKIT